MQHHGGAAAASAAAASEPFRSLPAGGARHSVSGGSGSGPIADTLTLTEMNARIVRLLQAQPGRSGMTLEELESSAGFAVASNTDLVVSLTSNPKLRFDRARNSLRYVAKYDAGDRYELLRLLRQRGREASTGSSSADERSGALDDDTGSGALPGFPIDDLEDTYPAAARDLNALSRVAADVRVAAAHTHHAVPSNHSSSSWLAGAAGGSRTVPHPSLTLAGGVVRVRSMDTTKSDMVFYRDDPSEWPACVHLRLLTQLPGTVTLTKGQHVAVCSEDLRADLSRNDLLVIVTASSVSLDSSSSSGGGSGSGAPGTAHFFRVNSATIAQRRALGLSTTGVERGRYASEDGAATAAAVAASKRSTERAGGGSGFAAASRGSFGDDDDEEVDVEGSIGIVDGGATYGAARGTGTTRMPFSATSISGTSSTLQSSDSALAAAGRRPPSSSSYKKDHSPADSSSAGADAAAAKGRSVNSIIENAIRAATKGASSSSHSGGALLLLSDDDDDEEDEHDDDDAAAEDNAEDAPRHTATSSSSSSAASSSFFASSAQLISASTSTSVGARPPTVSEAAPSTSAGARVSTASEAGIYAVSVGNAVMNTGGHFSAADTAPHVLRSTAVGYALPFNSREIPLDRPWEGESVSGCALFKWGMSTDLRVMWREVITHGALKTVAAAQTHQHAQAASAAAPAAAMLMHSSSASATDAAGGNSSFSEVAPVYAALSSSSSIAHARPFPADHHELRSEMTKVGLHRVSLMEEGTIVRASTAPPPSAAALAAAKRSQRRRRPDKRSFTVHTNAHIAGTAMEGAVKKARLAILKELHCSAEGST